MCTEGPVPRLERRCDPDRTRFLTNREMARTPSLAARHKVRHLLLGSADQVHLAELHE
jgi:hypothetical protein